MRARLTAPTLRAMEHMNGLGLSATPVYRSRTHNSLILKPSFLFEAIARAIRRSLQSIDQDTHQPESGDHDNELFTPGCGIWKDLVSWKPQGRLGRRPVGGSPFYLAYHPKQVRTTFNLRMKPYPTHGPIATSIVMRLARLPRMRPKRTAWEWLTQRGPTHLPSV